MSPEYILKFSDPQATLETVGGKGASLARLSRAGLPVPAGFHVTTAAYQYFVEANRLQPKILVELERAVISQPDSLKAASQVIQGFFMQGRMPEEITGAIQSAYFNLAENQAVVAVRSSATAEDLPDLSFAGQQETFLNIKGIEAVLEAVKRCWASLWTARAIGYRLQHSIDQNTVQLGVVVQLLVPAEAAGILFTMNPIDGRQDELVINAAWGLGESVVGGLVTPDSIFVDKTTATVKRMDIAEKTVITVPAVTGTVEKPLTDARRESQVLNEAQVSELALIARKIEDSYGVPQDIEWCLKDGKFYILQSRPVTALPEPEKAAPIEWKLPKGAYAAMRNNIVELMADPLSPLFATLGVSAINSSLHRLLYRSFGMGGIMPAEIILVVKQYAYFNGSVSLKSMARMIFNARKILKMMFTGAVERWTETGRPRYFKIIESWQAKDWRSFSAVELVESAGQLTEAAIDAYGALISGVIPAAWITEALFTRLYNRLIKRRDDPSASIYLLGFDNIPIRADKSLYCLAEWARGYPMLVKYVESMTTSQLVAKLHEITGSPVDMPLAVWEEWRQRFHEHLKQYGHTLYDLDFAHPLPADDPMPILETFKLYLRGQGTNPYTRQRESETRREGARQAMELRLKGWRLNLFNKYLSFAQKYAPLREDGLAEVGLAYPFLRQMLHELGDRFLEQKVISATEDIFWLTQQEVLAAARQLDAGQPVVSLAEVIPGRKAEHLSALRLDPPKALPQVKVFGYDLMSLKGKRRRGGKGEIIQGVATSPGKVTGNARVLHGPEDFSQMKPGEVLVASITTPAWTPLFACAAAVVTDIGGPLSHGSIVAREYGIPAVLGTGVATRRIRTGQVITVDGSKGMVILGKN